MKIVFLEKKNLGDDIDLSVFANLGEVEMYETSTREEAKKRITDADVVLINKIEMNEDLLKDAKNVKLICVTATGTNNIDFAYTNKRGILIYQI